MAAAGLGTYWLWLRMNGGPSVALESLALRSDALRLAEAVKGLSEDIDEFLLERIIEVRTWAESPVVVAAVKKGRAAHAKEGFDNLSITQIESRFRTRKTLGVASEARAYLREQVRLSPHFAEVFFTDEMGFNVAVTSATSDFVQSDEDWWQQAWASGFYVSDVEFDASANVWAVEVSVLVREGGNGKQLGVMKAVLSLRFAQLLADRLANRLSESGQLLHSRYAASPNRNPSTNPGAQESLRTNLIVVNRDGQLIAETRSSHARGRIMQPEINVLTNASLTHLAPAYEGDRSGFFIADREAVSNDSEAGSRRGYLVAFARSAGTNFYAPVVGNLAGFDWMVLAEAPNLTDRNALPQAVGPEAAGNWGMGQNLAWLGVGLFGALLLSSILLCWVFGKWVLTPVRALTDHVQRIEQGRIGASINVPSIGELAELASALDRIRGMIVRMADRLKQTTARDRPNAGPEAPRPARRGTDRS